MDPIGPFPFARLPTEVRLMVYERLPVQITRHDFTRANSTRAGATSSYSFAIVSKRIDLSILQTCSWVNDEASAIMRRKTEDIMRSPPRVIVDLASASKLHKPGGPLWHISRYFARRANKAGKSLGSVPYLGTGMGVTGKRYDQDSDPDYAKLAHLVARWFDNFDRQHIELSIKTNQPLNIEIALVAPENWPHQNVVYALRQLAFVLFAEHGGFHYTLRSVEEYYPAYTDDMFQREGATLDKVMAGRRGDVVRAVQGSLIEDEEYADEWSDGSYYCGSSC
ncbi:hypothetical protein EK21DRAFT_66820 [Setomelanomma holmii]|uniref:Uncharacterized protein n=1 Tax=Setomelanomma holmii TaxID=210430 RepID=A0A9P4HAZ7_9PLEO|nr:hypothetical protein EK21DRAFT_66820 [Setomelanomma holmii]